MEMDEKQSNRNNKETSKVLREKKRKKIGSALASDEIELFRCRSERKNFAFLSR